MIRAALRNPYLVIVIALGVTVVGIVSARKLPADLLPIFKTPAVQIVTFYPGMPPVVMEKDIMSRLQRWTGQSVGIEHQEAKAMTGVCIVKDFFREDISLDTAMSQVTSYAVSDMFYLPPGTVPPMVMPFDPTASVPLCLVSVSNPDMTEKELYDIAYYELRNRLQSIRGVIAPAVYGGTLRRILCYVDRGKLEARGLSLTDVQQALLKQNVLIPAGNAKMGDFDFQLYTNAIPDTVEKLNNAPIKMVDGAPVLIRDIGTVKDAKQIQSNIVRTNGARQVYIPIYRQPGENTLEIVGSIKERLARILARLKEMNSDNPKMKNLVLSVVMDQSTGVRESVDGLMIAAAFGALFAGLIVILFLRSWRLTAIILLSIPLSVLAALIGLFYTGDTINAMTLGGLALAVGILIDQSIVVIENIMRHARQGEPITEAAINGTREVALPIFVSTLTFILVFYPIVFLSGIARFLFTPLALAVTFAVVASFLVAIFFVPVCAAKLLQSRGVPDEEEKDWLTPIIEWYGRVLKKALAAKGLTLVISAAIFVGAMFLFTQTGTELFPQVDSGQFTIYMRMPSGTRIERTEDMVKRVEAGIIEELGEPDPGFAIGIEEKPQSQLQMLISNIGVLMDWPAAYTPNSGPMDTFMLVQLKDKSGRRGVFDVVTNLRKKLNEHPDFGSVEFAFDTGGMLTAALNMGEPSPIHFQIAGSNLDTAQQIAREIRDIAASVPGAVDVRIAQRVDYPALEVNIDRVLAAHEGLNVDDVMKNVVSATNSSINFEPAFWISPKNGNHYFLGVQYAEEDINSLDTLRYVPITGDGTQQSIPLDNVASIEQQTRPAVVNHRNITRVTDIYVNILPGYDIGSVCSAIEQKLEASESLQLTVEAKPGGPIDQLIHKVTEPKVYAVAGGEYAGRGYTVEMQGEVRSMRRAFWDFVGGLILASVLVFLAMVALMRSFTTPWVVMVTIPLGLVGVAGILWLTETNLNIQTLMGIIMMAGIVVEYSIVLLDFADHKVREGMSPADAVYEAAIVRFRPILMTSVTTILALTPMAIGFAGGDADKPLALTIVGAVIAATLLPKFVVPCLYAVVKKPGEPVQVTTDTAFATYEDDVMLGADDDEGESSDVEEIPPTDESGTES